MLDKTKLTIKEFSEIHGIPRSTVSLWCRNGFLSGAYQETTPFGDIWYIPKSTSDGFSFKPQRGRPKQQKEILAA